MPGSPAARRALFTFARSRPQELAKTLLGRTTPETGTQVVKRLLSGGPFCKTPSFPPRRTSLQIRPIGTIFRTTDVMPSRFQPNPTSQPDVGFALRPSRIHQRQGFQQGLVTQSSAARIQTGKLGLDACTPSPLVAKPIAHLDR